MNRKTTTIGRCLKTLGKDDKKTATSPNTETTETVQKPIGYKQILLNCGNRDEEFQQIKKWYFKKCLKYHPDKGGDTIIFRKVQTSFELLRDLHNGAKIRRGRGRNKITEEDDDGEWTFSECLLNSSISKKVAATRDNDASDKFSDDDDDEDSSSDYGDEENDNDVNNSDEEFDMSDYTKNYTDRKTPSWDYYEEAADKSNNVPPYKVELAKSARSKCKAKGKAKHCSDELIDKNEIRVGWIDMQSGSYGVWNHLRCWRVPYKIWVGLPDPTVLKDVQAFELALAIMNDCIICGFQNLSKEDKQHFAEHCMNKGNWARKTKRKAPPSPVKSFNNLMPSPSSENNIKQETSTSTTHDNKVNVKIEESMLSSTINSQMIPSKVHSSDLIVPTISNSLIPTEKKQRFIIPIPGKNGASHCNVFQDKTFVMTGLFPEVGGGAGLGLGKAKVKLLIESFGGRVTSAISGKTDFLIVGKKPGMSKVSKARARSKIVMTSICDLSLDLDNGCECLEDFEVVSNRKPMLIESFSAGYSFHSGKSNGLALTANKTDLLIAHGLKQHPNATKEAKIEITNNVDGIDEKKKAIVKKRKATIKEDNTDCTNKIVVVPSKRTSKRVKKKSTSTPIVTQKPKIIKSTKKSAPKKKKTKAAVPQEIIQADEEKIKITCDKCGIDCTIQSWHLPIIEQDYCKKCSSQNSYDGAVQQSNGENIN